MTGNFTITIRRKKIFVTDAGMTTTYVEERQHGCPAALVATWRRLYPDAFVSAELEENDRARGRASQSYERRQFERREPRPQESAAPVAGLDYGALINRELK